MIQRWKIYGNQAAAVTEPDGEYMGEYVEYTDHLAAMEEKDKDYGRIFLRQLDVIKEQEKLLDHKDREISDLKRGIERLRSELKLAYALGKQDITIYDAETLLKEDGDG